MSDLTENPTTVPQLSNVKVVPHPGNITIMHLSGPLDRESAPLARAEITAAIAEGQPNLILDVRDVPGIDGAGANSLLFGMHRAQQAGGDLSLVAPTDQVRQRLELAALDDVVPSHDTVVEALEALEADAAVDDHKANDRQQRVPSAAAHES